MFWADAFYGSFQARSLHSECIVRRRPIRSTHTYLRLRISSTVRICARSAQWYYPVLMTNKPKAHASTHQLRCVVHDCLRTRTLPPHSLHTSQHMGTSRNGYINVLSRYKDSALRSSRGAVTGNPSERHSALALSLRAEYRRNETTLLGVPFSFSEGPEDGPQLPGTM